MADTTWPTAESDAWALGMLLFEIFALQVPFAEAQCTVDLTRVRESVPAGTVPSAPTFYGREYLMARICDPSDPTLRPPLCDDAAGRASSVPMDVSPLLAACWHHDPAQRMSAGTLAESLRTLLHSM